jgi:hypothetical protein
MVTTTREELQDMKRRPTTYAIVAACSLAAANTGFASAATASTTVKIAAASLSATPNLAGVCPPTVKIQINWTPEAEQGAYYELASSSGTINGSQKYYTAPLLDPASGLATGVKVDLIAGGPAVGYTDPERLLYEDPSILLGMDASDSQIEAFSTTPTIGVVSPMYLYDNVFFWNPAKIHLTSIASMSSTNATVLTYGAKGALNLYLEAKGELKASQVDGSYNGTPDQFVATGGDVISGGYATYEPYFYSHQLTAWDKPIAYELIANTGYNPYSEVTFTTPKNLSKYAACFVQLVPMLQQAEINYEKDPTRVNQLIVKLDDAYKIGGGYNLAVAEYARNTLLSDGIVANPPSGGFGSFTMSRINQLIGLLESTKAVSGLPQGFSASSLVTNKFIDPNIHMTFFKGPYHNTSGVVIEG